MSGRSSTDSVATYVRFESPTPNSRGHQPGVFALANGLARSGRLIEADRAWWRAANDWFNAVVPNPADVDPTLFDRLMYPRVSCWFRSSAERMLVRVQGYLDLLDRYDVTWVKRTSSDPGRVLYADTVQLVVVPYH